MKECAAALGLLLAGLQDAELPGTERELFEFATARVNREGWKDADRAFKRFLEKFPGSDKTERVLWDLATLHLWHSDRFAEARETCLKLCERFPKSPKYWEYRLGIPYADVRQNQRGRAVQELRKIVQETADPEVRALAILRAWIIQDKVFDLIMGGPAALGEAPSLQLSLRNVSDTKFRVTYVRHDALPLAAARDAYPETFRAALAKVGAGGRRVLKEWSETWTYEKGRPWRVESVRMPSTDSGIYLVDVEHDGVVRGATIFHFRYELIARIGAGRVSCLVQERGTAKPAAGSVVRIVRGDQVVEGVTDAEGRFAPGRYRGGSLLAIHEGELLAARLVYEGRPAPPALLDAPVLWTQAIEGAEAVAKIRPENPRRGEPVHRKDFTVEWEREADRAGVLPEVIADEASWRKVVAFLESELKLPAATLDQLRKAKPDFSKEMLATVLLESGASLKGVFEEAGAIKIWIRTDVDGGGPPPPPDRSPPAAAPRKLDVRLLKLPKSALDVVILDDVHHFLRPSAPPAPGLPERR